MEEEIVVDDIDENSSAETQQRDGSTTPVMPLLYIQNKLRATQSTNANQTLVSPSTQLTAIINPVNNQVIICRVYNICASYLILAFFLIYIENRNREPFYMNYINIYNMYFV